ncbi:phage tail length tape-measure protein [Hydrogenimonas sp.]|nr:phage tail length tape-measure protein [Hydrogenimonas sp.]
MSIKTMGLSIVLGMSAAGVELAAGRAIKSIDKIGSTVSRLKNRRLKLIEDNIDVKKASDRLSTLQKTIDALYKKRSAIKIKLSTAKSQDEIDALKRKLAETGRKISGLNAHKIKVADRLKQARLEAERTDRSIAKIGKTIESINRYKLAIDANLRKRAELKSTISDKIALGITVAAPLKFAVDFESAMARVKALSGATDEQLKALSDTARKLGATTVFSASEAAEGMQYLAKV